MTIQCPHCGGHIRYTPRSTESQATCPYCGKAFTPGKNLPPPVASGMDGHQVICLAVVVIVAAACFLVSCWVFVAGLDVRLASTEREAAKAVIELSKASLVQQAMTGVTMAAILAMLIAIYVAGRNRDGW